MTYAKVIMYPTPAGYTVFAGLALFSLFTPVAADSEESQCREVWDPTSSTAATPNSQPEAYAQVLVTESVAGEESINFVAYILAAAIPLVLMALLLFGERARRRRVSIRSADTADHSSFALFEPEVPAVTAPDLTSYEPQVNADNDEDLCSPGVVSSDSSDSLPSVFSVKVPPSSVWRKYSNEETAAAWKHYLFINRL